MKQDRSNSPVSPATAAPRERGADSIPELIRNLATDLSDLLGKEIALAKAEVRENVNEVQTAIGAAATGGAIALAGLVILLLSAVYGLSNVVDPWLAALIVGAAALIIGYIMVKGAKSKMSAHSMAPNRTIESARKDKETLKRATR
jgi:hypothetical protein